MMILPMLMALAAQDAAKLPEPVQADSANILYAPTRSVRSATAAAAASLSATPVTVRLQCTVLASRGQPISCIPLDAGAKPVTAAAELKRRRDAWVAGAASAPPATIVAMQRVMLTRVRPTAAANDPAEVQMIFNETVSAGDAVRFGDPIGIIEARDIEMDERPDPALMEAYYPIAALRGGLEARAKATCRVMPDRKLLCRDAELIGPDAALTPAVAGEFRNATYQVFDSIRLSPLSKAGDPVVGREIDMRISFVLPH